MMKIKKSFKAFTLIELMAAMGVFAIIMIIVLTFFTSAQSVMSISIQRTMAYENARIALDLIARDLQCAYYENGRIPFWFKGYTNLGVANAVYDQEALCFVSATSLPANVNCSSNLCEIKYQLYNSTQTAPPWESLEGWLLRSATGNMTDANANNSTRWNYYISPPWPAGVVGRSGSVFSIDSTSSGDPVSGDFHKVIPYVTKLEFSCFKRNGDTIPPDPNGDGTACDGIGCFPYEVKIDLTLMDGSAWAKWKAMGGYQYIFSKVLKSGPSPIADDFRQKNERTFSKTVLLGDRGQGW